MPIHKKFPDDIKEVDVIVAGGGTAGCIVASRLSDADPNLSILVIEGGQNNHNLPEIVNPLLYLSNIAPTSKNALFWKARKSNYLADREVIVPTGGVLGGGSSINFMMYTRAQRSDFDSWKTKGWSADELLPFMKKLETYHGRGQKEVHGYNGPIHVSSSTYRGSVAEDEIVKAASELGWPEIHDLQDLDSNNGTQRWLRYVSPDGKRQDVAHRYLHPRLLDGKHPNLHVVCESQVARVLFDDNKKAVGVEYRANPAFQLPIGGVVDPVRTVKARKMVIVSCGACGTPGVLERSGVGNPEILNAAKVPVVADVPGVGNDYQDHHLIFYPYKVGLATDETLDGIITSRMDAVKLVQDKHRLAGWNGIDFSSKIRPNDEGEIDALGPEFRAAWDKDFKNEPNRPLMLLGMVNAFLGEGAPEAQYVSMAPYTAYPYSRGSIHITGPSLDDPYDFDAGYFSDPHSIDIKKQLWAYKKQRQMIRRTAMFRGELAAGHPRFPAGSKAACIEDHQGGPLLDDIPYSAEDDEAIVQWCREGINTTWHSLGTCKMAPREDKGVVDANLNVYGTTGLKLADLSIPPENVGANTNNTALVIGEKAADIFIRELGLAAA
ncbi:alcohol oxidase-like protein [Microdochium trichocladiopsis]|uniref:Alcohol oxidase-like protein n=1 Tax=Microdochium trichocladiopsis TaxID=1682393 RepID=A0A9P8YGE4_9PEZI|nr:alcohol oxidase-like protein [Microdochium trichocladiopsis]KAH7037509.1 alcohol oxidase-like protein [Microdochium trichocladiopsis]